MTKFFIPGYTAAEAERYLKEICAVENAIIPERRILKLAYTHADTGCTAEVGKVLHCVHKESPEQIILAILPCDSKFKVIISTRVIIIRDPHLIEYFDED